MTGKVDENGSVFIPKLLFFFIRLSLYSKGHNGQFQFELDQADALLQDGSGSSSGSGSGSGDGSGFGIDHADLIPDTADSEKQPFDFMLDPDSIDDFIFIEDETVDV